MVRQKQRLHESDVVLAALDQDGLMDFILKQETDCRPCAFSARSLRSRCSEKNNGPCEGRLTNRW